MGDKYYIGIDLGTTNTLVSYFKNEKQYKLKFDGKNILPSVMYVDVENENQIYVGAEAEGMGKLDPDNRVASAKTYMGTEKKYVFRDKTGKAIVMTPTDVATQVLKKAKEKFQKKRKLTEEDEIYAVITTPAAFSFQQNEQTIIAARNAGLKVLGTRPEPVAAAISCVHDMEEHSTIFVVDIGGGTFDTAFITFDRNLVPNLIGSEGDRRLGGDDFDETVFAYVKEQAEDEWGIDLSTQDASGLSYRDYNMLISTLRDQAKRAKEELSRPDAEDYPIVCEELFVIKGYNDDKPVSFRKKVKRTTFDRICQGIYDKIEHRIDESIRQFEKKGHHISEVTHLVLVGGTCYIPSVIELIEKKVGLQAVKIGDKTTAVADGAAIIANSWTVFGKELGGVLAQSMGVREKGDVLSKVIEKGSNYPCKASRIYTTVKDNQKSVNVSIYAAAPDKEEVPGIYEHEYYGHFVLDGIEQASKGTPQIEVTFEFDNSQQLTVTAKDLKTGSTKTIEVQKGAYKEEEMVKSMSIDLLIDVSGSMRGQKLIDAENACLKLIEEIVDLNTNEVGVTTFNDEAHNLCPLTSEEALLKKNILRMKAEYTTRMDRGLEESCSKLLKGRYEEKVIFLVTDGAPDQGDSSVQVAERIRKMNNMKVVVIFIAVADARSYERGYQFAKKVAKANALEDEALFYTAEDMSDLGKIFTKVYADIVAQ